MKTFKKMAAQGDMIIIRRDKLPEGVGEMIPTEGGAHILTHSETGHHHQVLDRPGVEHFKDSMNLLRSFLVIPEGEPAKVEHLRATHTHETLLLEPGVYEIRRQREFDATQGLRRAAD